MLRIMILLITLTIFHPGPGYSAVSQMLLMGKGEVYYLGIIKVYDAALSVEGKTNGQKIMDSETSRCLKLTYDVSLAVKDFVRGAETVLARQHPPEELAKMRREIDLLHGAYRDVRKGDSYSLCYDAPRSLTILTLNDTELVAVHSKDFAKAYFGIWLGAVDPIDKKLRDQLLKGTGENLAAK